MTSRKACWKTTRMMSFSLLLFGVPFVVAQGNEQSPGPPASAVKTFKDTCASCHGASGEGSDLGKALKVPDLRSKTVQDMTDDDIRKVIASGKANMPAFGSQLSSDDINGLLAVIRSFAPKQKTNPAIATQIQ